MTIDLKPNEIVVKAGDSNHLSSDKRIKGKLILTNQRIYFKTTNEPDVTGDLEIVPANIKEVHYFNTTFLTSNGLNIITKDGKELRLAIKKRNSWVIMINKMY